MQMSSQSVMCARTRFPCFTKPAMGILGLQASPQANVPHRAYGTTMPQGEQRTLQKSMNDIRLFRILVSSLCYAKYQEVTDTNS